MRGRPPVAGLRAVVVAMMLAALPSGGVLAEQIRPTLPGMDAKPQAVNRAKRPFRPTLPQRNPTRVSADITASIRVDADSTTLSASGAEAAGIAGASSAASVAVAGAGMAPQQPIEVAAAEPASEPETTAALADAEDTAPTPPEASADQQADSTAASPEPDEASSDEATADEAKEATSAVADSAPSDESAPDVSAPEPDAAEEAQAEPADDSTDAEASDVADTAEVAADDGPADDAGEQSSAKADPASPTESSPAKETAPKETARLEVEPVEAEPVEAEPEAAAPKETARLEAKPDQAAQEPPEPEAKPATAVVDVEQADEPVAAAPEPVKAVEPSHDATVVIDVLPPPAEAEASADDAKPVEMAAVTPPTEPAPTPAIPTVDETPANADAEETPADGEAAETPATGEDAAEDVAAPEETVVEAPPPPPAHPIVAAIRTTLADPAFRKGFNAPTLKGLEDFYGAREGPPLWITADGFSPEAKALIAEIGNADDWGLDARDFDAPKADARPSTEDEQAAAELKLAMAVLKYARYAQGGGRSPSSFSSLFDQKPELSSATTLLTEIAAAPEPATYLTSLHPQHEQFKRLRAALVKALARAAANGRRPRDDGEVQLLVINMERWRWLPRSLGSYHVWNNVPEFNVRVMKDGKPIYLEKTIVGQDKYATPFFSAPMRNIVFHPNWTVPPTIVNEDLAPKLQAPSGLFSPSKTDILQRYGLSVSYKGQPIDADEVNWKNVNLHEYTFTQDPGPSNVLGKFKFNFPNRHAIYMHDTVQPELFAERVRTLSHGCIRVHDPDRFAALLLAQDKGWSYGQIQNLVAKDASTVIGLNRKVPVHLTYFTATIDDNGGLNRFGDIYGIDNRMAAKLFDNPARFPVPATPAIAEQSSRSRDEGRSARRASGGGLDSLISGLFGN